jgi:hypothetical protein
MPVIILSIVYVIGYALSFCMLRIEQEADQEVYTKGDRVACVFISLFSFIAVLGLLIAAWVRGIRDTGYWNRPANGADHPEADNTPFTVRTESLNDDDE